MKNYLFRPFSNDDDKIAEFNTIRDYLPKKFRHELIMFMGSLESYYDNIISELRSKCAVAVADDRIIKELQADNKELKAVNDGLLEESNLLKAENKQLTQTIKYSNGNDGLYDEIVEGNEYLEEQIKELRNSKIEFMTKAQSEIKELKAELVTANDGINDLNDVLKDLQAELQSVNDDYNNDHKVHNEYEDGLLAEIKELKADNVELKESNKKLSKSSDGAYMEILNRSNDKLQAENETIKQCYEGSKVKVKALQVEINVYIKTRDKRIDMIKELQAENKRLMKQVNSKWSNNSNAHTIKGEIAEYMSHNEKCGGARLFLIPRDEFKNDEYDNTIYWDDGIE